MNEKYEILLNTPFGVEKGTLIFNINGENLNGIIIARGIKNNFTNGFIKNGQFMFSGNLNVVIMRVNYTARGQINKNILSAEVDTNLGKFNVSGKKIN